MLIEYMGQVTKIGNENEEKKNVASILVCK